MSNDVAALIAAEPLGKGTFATDGTATSYTGDVFAYRERILALIPPNAILIDPTAPETVAALAEALDDAEDRDGLKPYPGWGKRHAVAILPAFIARLRGET